MPTPQITITPAGFAAIVNAENTGTAPVKITQVGLTAQHFDVATVGAAVPNETKRLTTFGGKAIADDTLHLNVRDDGQDTYTLRGFGLYLEGGTLFAVYSQATPIMEKAAAATLLLATDIRFTNITATSIEVGDVDFINPPASTTQLGVVRLATEQEADGGADHTTAITPRGLAGYINRRFGIGAPSTFVKSLLGAATAAIFRVELGLKSAAIRDEGHGNGLNSDLLDGEHGAYYLDWRNFSNLPSSFTPGNHRHPISDVDGLKDALDGKQPSGSYAAAAHGHSNYIGNSGPQVLVGNLTSKIGDLGETFGSGLVAAEWEGNSGNADFLTLIMVRRLAEVGWGGAAWRLQRRVDNSPQSYIDLGGESEGESVSLGNTSGNKAWLSTSGSWHCSGGFDYGSSRKLKNIEGRMPYGLSEVRKINTWIGKYKPQYNSDDRKRLFFDAEQFMELMPEAVDAKGISFMGEYVPAIKLDQVMPPAYRAISQLADIVDGLAKQISDLRAEIESLRPGQVV